jgi:tetratricopeptide (TPR) repeat protein
MSDNVRWLAVFLLVILGGWQLTGQDCPSVAEALKSLYASEDGGDALVQRIKENCPAATDSLSIIFHKRSVYAYSSEQDFEGAITYALKALEAQEEVYAEKAEEPLGKTFANLGLFYRITGQYTTSLPYLRRANAIFTDLGIYGRKHNNQQQLVKLWRGRKELKGEMYGPLPQPRPKPYACWESRPARRSSMPPAYLILPLPQYYLKNWATLPRY